MVALKGLKSQRPLVRVWHVQKRRVSLRLLFQCAGSIAILAKERQEHQEVIGANHVVVVKIIDASPFVAKG